MPNSPSLTSRASFAIRKLLAGSSAPTHLSSPQKTSTARHPTRSRQGNSVRRRYSSRGVDPPARTNEARSRSTIAAPNVAMTSAAAASASAARSAKTRASRSALITHESLRNRLKQSTRVRSREQREARGVDGRRGGPPASDRPGEPVGNRAVAGFRAPSRRRPLTPGPISRTLRGSGRGRPARRASRRQPPWGAGGKPRRSRVPRPEPAEGTQDALARSEPPEAPNGSRLPESTEGRGSLPPPHTVRHLCPLRTTNSSASAGPQLPAG